MTAPLVERPLSCDLLTHVTLSLEREVAYDHVRAFRTVALAGVGEPCLASSAPT